MNARKLFQKPFLVFASCSLLASGCTSSSQAPEHNGKFSEPSQEQTKEQDPPAFVACHPPNSDLSPDGSVFVTLTPGAPTLNILRISEKQKQSVMKLPRPVQDVILLSAEKAVLSFGLTGEVALVNLEKGEVGETIKVGESTAGMCRSSKGQALVADPQAGRIYLFDPENGSIVQSFPMDGKPQQMRWVIQDFEIEAADAAGNPIDTIDLTQESPSEARENQ